jgi:hypothetical protein
MCWCTLIIEEFKLQEFVGPMYSLFLYIINGVLLLVSCGIELNICFQLHQFLDGNLGLLNYRACLRACLDHLGLVTSWG